MDEVLPNTPVIPQYTCPLSQFTLFHCIY